VRQGFSPLFDVPVKIENPEEPLGNARIYRNGFQNEGAAIAGTSCPIRRNFLVCPRVPRRARSAREANRPIGTVLDKANAALDRIEYPRIRLRGLC